MFIIVFHCALYSAPKDGRLTDPRAPRAASPRTSRLAQHMMNDSTSWGSVDDPIGTLMCRAAFFVVEYPSPATRAELAEAREKDLVAKVSQEAVGFKRDLGCRFEEGTFLANHNHRHENNTKALTTAQVGEDDAKSAPQGVQPHACVSFTFRLGLCLTFASFCVGFRRKEQSSEADCPCWKVQTEGARTRVGTSSTGRRTGENTNVVLRRATATTRVRRSKKMRQLCASPELAAVCHVSLLVCLSVEILVGL